MPVRLAAPPLGVQAKRRRRETTATNTMRTPGMTTMPAAERKRRGGECMPQNPTRTRVIGKVQSTTVPQRMAVT
jgi:hypothetical protein